MPTTLPLQIRKAPTVYEIANFSRDTNPFRTGNDAHFRTSPRTGTFYSGAGSGKYVENVGATGFEFVKPTSGTPTYRYYPSLNRYNWNYEFLNGTLTYADSGHSNYAFWQSISPDLYAFLESYHSGGLPADKLIRVWVSWDKYVSVSPRSFAFFPDRDPGEQWRYTEKRRAVTYLAISPSGVCCRYAIFS